jgi:GNAT superfamily N-acetyltransferase
MDSRCDSGTTGADVVEIRPADAGEYSAVDALAVRAWQVLKPGYDPTQWDEMLLGVGRTSKLAEQGRLLVAAAHEELYGSVVYMPPGRSNPKIFPADWPSIRMLVVEPSRRGGGIGKALTAACIDEALKDGARCIGLHTSPIMEVALPMYLRMGFVKDADLAPIGGAPYARYVLYL